VADHDYLRALMRAAHNLKEAHAGTTFAVTGPSQGGHAALFAGQLAPTYAPDLKLVGVAASAPPTDLKELFRLKGEGRFGKVLSAYALDAWYDRAKTTMFMATDRPHALRQAINACRKGGTVSIPGVYGGWLDKFPLGAAFAKGADAQDGPDPHAQVHAHSARTHRTRRDRSVRRRL